MGNVITLPLTPTSMHTVADDVTKTLGDLRSNALENLHEMLRIYEKPIPTVRDDELDAFKLQVENRMLLVAFVGEGSAGKSTLINAILRDKFLPSGCGKTTNMRVYIKHNPNIHTGVCQKGCNCEECPKLLENLGTNQTPLCTGVDNIREEISSRNKKAENSKKNVVLVIETNVEMFNNRTLHCTNEGLTVYIVDCPGMECLREDTGAFFTITSQMIYILNYSRFLHDKEKVLKEMDKKPSSAKLSFAVTQFDHYYTPGTGQDNPDENNVKQCVSEAFKDVQKDDVFPVCGRWVLNAYLLENRPDDMDSQYVVQDAYRCHMGKTKGEQNSVMIDTVLNLGGLKELEERICKSVGNTDLNDWKKVIFSQAEKLLQKPIEAAEDLLKEMRKDREVLRLKMTDGQRKDKKITKALEHIQNSCDKMSVIRETEDKFKIEDVSLKAKQKWTSSLNTLKTHCNREAQQSNYTVGTFDQEYAEFKEKTLPYEIKEIYRTEFMTLFWTRRVNLRADLKEIASLLEEDINEEYDSNAELNSEFPPNLNLDFSDPLRLLRKRTQSERFYHRVKLGIGFGGAGVAGVAGVGGIVGGVVGPLFAVPPVAIVGAVVAVPVAAIGVAAGVGFGGYQLYKALKTNEKEQTIREEDLEEIHKQSIQDINSEKNKDLLRKYFESGKTLYQNVIAEYAQNLLDIYQRNLKKHHEEFQKTLHKNIPDLERITKQITKLEAAHEELKKADSFIKEMLERQTFN